LRWCRTFVVRGRVTCPDGSPVPGAEVCAYDVDWLWWWKSQQQVDCAYTDVNGNFEMKFRWCCGWWPWWWWRHRVWEIDPFVIDRLRPALERYPDLRFERAGSRPSLKVFEKIVGSRVLDSGKTLEARDVGLLESVRKSLVERLPRLPEVESLRIWPWWPWWPWWDCTPDLIFKVTQDCGEGPKVVLDEGYGDVRWNVSNPLDVQLIVSDDACCVEGCQDPPCEGGHCLTPVRVCSTTVNKIGGNPGAPATIPVGYVGRELDDVPYIDRPFARTVNVYKAAVPMTGVDYYSIEYDDGTGWDDLPVGWAKNISRSWLTWDPVTGIPETGWAHFPFADKNGKWVMESREHFEANGPFGDWAPGGSRVWMIYAYLVMRLDSPKFDDGTYRFRIRGYAEDAAGNLVLPGEVLDNCGTTIDNEVVLTFDNRLEDDPAHPAGHASGPDTIHRPVIEPDTDFIQVLINGQQVDACDVVNATTGTLEIRFEASDPDGHLSHFGLSSHWGESEARNLFSYPHTLVKEGTTPYLGPTYEDALSDGAPRPEWKGGTYRLTMDLEDACPEPCCYLFRLRAYKRNIVGCDYDKDFWNVSEYSLGVGVCPPVVLVERPEVEEIPVAKEFPPTFRSREDL
jgi:hypothetical protein